MIEWWPVLLGWPAVLVALGLSIFAMNYKRPGSLYLAAVLILPISLYLAATPRLRYFALLAPVALLLAGYAIKRQQMSLAFLLVLPVFSFFAWLALLVFNLVNYFFQIPPNQQFARQ